MINVSFTLKPLWLCRIAEVMERAPNSGEISALAILHYLI